MSERDDRANEPEHSSIETDAQSSSSHKSAYQAKRAVHERDRYTCISCQESFDEMSDLHADHVVPRGAAGPDAIRNKASLCPRCHEAKHGERDHAPTIRCISTGDMIKKDFRWFLHFWQEQLPALSKLAVDYRIDPKHNMADSKRYQAWHISLGDLRRLDELLADDDDVRYAGMKLHHYM